MFEATHTSILRRSTRRVVAAAAATLLMTSLGAVSEAAFAPAVVSSVPVSYTPWLLSTTPDQFVYEIDQCGSLMYAVGRVSAIGQGSLTYSRGNAFSFSASDGAMTPWDPQADGPIRSIAFSPDCSIAYLGGLFTSIRGVAANHIAAVDTATGNVIDSFARNAAGDVYTVELVKGQVIVGGTFTAVNGFQRSKLASLDPITGKPTQYLTMPAVGGLVSNSQVSHSGDKMLIEGNFVTIGGVTRHVMAMLDLGPTSATLNDWYSLEFNENCGSAGIGHHYVRDAAWSPDDLSVYIASTGAWPAGGQTGPRTGLCDAAAKFPASAQVVSHTWINYTGCDSLYAVEATSDTVYIGGHERWSSNPNGCDFAGPGALSRPGIAALDAAGGSTLSWNPTRALGYGADDMLVTSTGLWVASDIFRDGLAQQCGGLLKHGGICFFPN